MHNSQKEQNDNDVLLSVDFFFSTSRGKNRHQPGVAATGRSIAAAPGWYHINPRGV
jgi:hypothetical protein